MGEVGGPSYIEVGQMVAVEVPSASTYTTLPTTNRG